MTHRVVSLLSVEYGRLMVKKDIIQINWDENQNESYEYSVFEYNGGLTLMMVFSDGKRYFKKAY